MEASDSFALYILENVLFQLEKELNGGDKITASSPKRRLFLGCFRPAPTITSDSQKEQETGDALGEKRLIRVEQTSCCCQFWFCRWSDAEPQRCDDQ